MLFKLISFVLCISTGFVFANEGNTLNLTEVADGIYVHAGMHLGFEEEHADDIANIGFIVGSECIAVIDTGGSYKIGELLKKEINKISDVPICYVINTHIHYDHVLGNAAFKDTKVKFVGHKGLAEELEYNKEFFLEQFSHFIDKENIENVIVKPDIEVENTMNLDLGNREIVLTAYHRAHTDTDLTIIDINTNTLWLSDLLFMERIPAIDGSIKGWLSVMEELKQRDFKLVIPGHGPVSAKWPSAAKSQYAYLKSLHDEVEKEIDRGAFMEDIIETVLSEEKKKWLLHEENHRRNVSKTFTELEW